MTNILEKNETLSSSKITENIKARYFLISKLYVYPKKIIIKRKNLNKELIIGGKRISATTTLELVFLEEQVNTLERNIL